MRVKVASLRSDLAEILRAVNANPVTVLKHGEPIAVIISTEDFAEFEQLRSMYRTLSKHPRERLASSLQVFS